MKNLAPTCQALQAELTDYLDGELDPVVCAELERHLADCDNCRIVVDTLRKTILLYREYGTLAMSTGAHERLIKVLDLAVDDGPKADFDSCYRITCPDLIRKE